VTVLTPYRRFALVRYARPMMQNDRTHWAVKAGETADWRFYFKIIAKEAKIPHLERVRIEVNHYRTRGRWPDVAGCAPAAKAAIDGIVDAGVLDDDDPTHVIDVTYNVLQMPPNWKKPGVTSALQIVIVEVLADSDVTA